MTDWREKQAAARTRIHEGQASHRPLSDRSEEIGLAGEELFSQWSGLPIDRELRPQGSNSINFSYRGRTFNVYTARHPKNLLVEEGKAKADYYVLCGWDAAVGAAYFVGWQFHQRLTRDAPFDRGGKGVISYVVPAGKLLSMGMLAHIMSIRPDEPWPEYDAYAQSGDHGYTDGG